MNKQLLLDAMREEIKKDPDFFKKLEKELKKQETGDLIIRKAIEENDSDDYEDKLDSSNLNLTQNGAVAYKSTGKPFVDLNFTLSAFRKAEDEELEKLLQKFGECFREDPVLAWKYMFYVGDVREGAGERKAFLSMFNYMMVNEDIDVITTILDCIPAYTRYDMWFKIWESAKNISENYPQFEYLRNMKTAIGGLVSQQFAYDIDNMRNGDSVSLLAKWMPSINTSSKRTKMLAYDTMEMLGFDPHNPSHQRRYRRELSELRAYIKVVEKSMSGNKWEDIDYETIPSKAALKYKSAFEKHDADRYTEYINKAVEGKARFNASVTQPHEIISKVRTSNYDPVLIAAWNNLKNVMVEDTIVVCDTSGSMGATVGGTKNICARDVAIGLSIYCAERLKGCMKDKFITFSTRPTFVDMSGCNNIYEKYRSFKPIVDDTNIQAVFALLANAYRNGTVKKAEMPSRILIISDMQFNSAIGQYDDSYNFVPLFDAIKTEWNIKTDGKVDMPKLIFWNLCDYDAETIPMMENENGLILLSGFSINQLRMAMSGQYDPFIALYETLSSPRYQQIEDKLSVAYRLSAK